MASMMDLRRDAAAIQLTLDKGGAALLVGNVSQWQSLSNDTRAELLAINVTPYYMTTNPVPAGEVNETAVNLTGHSRQIVSEAEK